MGTVTGTTRKKAGKKPAASRRSGRPPKAETARIRDRILDVAAVFFFTEGYGATSIEAIARRGRIAKRTIYSRFSDKAALFRAVVHRVVERLRPAHVEPLFEGKTTRDILHGLARVVLHASLSSEALALHRIVLAEATRFPELALIVSEQGSRQEAIRRIAGLLERDSRERDRKPKDSLFAAEQFLHMVTASPQRRALGLGQPMNTGELESWANSTVDLFLDGYRGQKTLKA